MEIKGTEKQKKFANEILEKFGYFEILKKAENKKIEETSYRSEESYSRAKESVKKLLNIKEIESSFIIDSRKEHDAEFFICAIATKFNIKHNFSRLLIF